MKRWIVVLLIVIAVIILISPGIVGRLAEKNIESNIAWAEVENPGVDVSTISFARGWFTSAGQHRVVLEGGAFRDASELYADEGGSARPPSLLISTRIDHGLLPLTSLSRDSGSLLPGLASTMSTFQIDTGSGDLIDLPGVLYSNVGLLGASESRFLLQPGEIETGGVHAEWQGADLTIFLNPASGSLGVLGTTAPFSITEDSEALVVGETSVALEQVRSEFGFNVGFATLETGAIEVRSITSPVAIAGMKLHAENEIKASRMDAGSTISVTGMAIPGFGLMDLDVDIAMQGFDAASLGVIRSAFRDAQAATDPDAALQAFYPDIENEMQTLVASGGQLRFERLDLSMPQGLLQTSMDINLAELDRDAAFTWPAVLLAMTATLNLKIPAELYDMAQMMNPEIATLLAMGVLMREGDDYVVDAEYAQGLLNVNGAPMPIPMPGM